MSAVAKIAKRGTGVCGVRLYQKIPARLAKNYDAVSTLVKFCLRRLAPEGLLPKPPQTSELELFVSYLRPVFRRRRHLRNKVRFVQRSVANNVADYLKVNFAAAKKLLIRRQSLQNENTQRIIRYAVKKINFRL